MLVVLAATLLPDVRLVRSPRPAHGYARLLASRPFLLFLATASLLQCSHAAYYGFATLHWRAAGLDEATIGLLWAEGVVAEIILFAFAGAVVRRIGIVPLFAIAAAAGVVRWLVTGATTELWALALVQILHAGTLGRDPRGTLVAFPEGVKRPSGNADSVAELGNGEGELALVVGHLRFFSVPDIVISVGSCYIMHGYISEFMKCSTAALPGQ